LANLLQNHMTDIAVLDMFANPELPAGTTGSYAATPQVLGDQERLQPESLRISPDENATHPDLCENSSGAKIRDCQPANPTCCGTNCRH